MIIGLRLAKPHTNAHGLIHGGLIATLADNAMGYSCAHQMGWTSFLATMGLAVDFIGTAQVGQWLAIEPDVIKTGSTICFAESFIKAGSSCSDFFLASETKFVNTLKMKCGFICERRNFSFIDNCSAIISFCFLSCSILSTIKR